MMPIGPLAELAIEKAVNRGLRSQLTDAQAIATRREHDAYEQGMAHGRAAWPIGFLMGAMIGAAAIGLYFVLFA